MTGLASRHKLELDLKRAEEGVATSPSDLHARLARARLLTSLGRNDDAKAAYMELLSIDSGHLDALLSFGRLLYATGYRTAARTVYARAVERHPDSADAHVNLADALAAQNHLDSAVEHYDAALRIDPGHVNAHRGMADVLCELRQEDMATHHRRKGYIDRPILELPYYGDATPINVLMLVSVHGGMVRLQHHLDCHVFKVRVLFVEFFDAGQPLPDHDVLVNAIGNADRCADALRTAIDLAGKSTAPVINAPKKVLSTSRVDTARLLGEIDGVVTPRTNLLHRSFLEGDDAAGRLLEMGYRFPILLRPPGFHTGRYFLLANDGPELSTNLASLPGDELLAIQYLDSRSADGKVRKYRAMIVDGELYPLHAAVSTDWKVHYFTAEMADNPEHRAEDMTFLNDMRSAIGDKAIAALERVRETLGLDYGGIDFGVDANGDVLIFEANASMVVYAPDSDPRWDYRRPAVQAIFDAIRRLLTDRAAKTPS